MIQTSIPLCQVVSLATKPLLVVVDQWYEAMDIELEALRNKQTIIEIKQADVPQGKQIIKSTRAFRRKRHPNGEIHKLKARFVVRSDLQILDNCEGTYSPG
jgi:hypothetical protein